MSLSTVALALVALGIGGLAGYRLGRRARRPVCETCLKDVLETAPVAVVINTRDGQNLFRNAQAIGDFHATEEAFRTEGAAAAYVHPEQRAAYIERLYRDGRVDAEEIEFRKGTGDRYTGRISSSVIDFAGQRCHISWIYDVSGEKRADAARRDLAERLEMALDATGAAAWDADLTAGTCWWSASFARMLGFDEPPVMGSDFWESRLHPDEKAAVMREVNAHLEGKTPGYEMVYRLQRADGSWMWIEDKGRVVGDADGRPVRYLGIMTDLTPRRLAEERLRRSEERLLRIMEASPIAVNITTRDGRWLFCNGQAEQIFGSTVAEMKESRTREFYVDPEDRRRLLERLDREGAFRDAEVAFRRKDGTVVWVLSSWSGIEFEGQWALLTWLYDITDRKKAEAALRSAKEEAERALVELRRAQESLIQAEAMASLGQLVAGVAHDINTPIGIALTAATHLAEQTGDMRQRFEAGGLRKADLTGYLDSVGEGCRLLVSNVERAAELVHSFKQVAVDQASGDRRSFDLKTYIGEVIYSLRPRLKRSGHTVTIECPDDLRMDTYPGALSQVLTNLVINAVIHAWRSGTTGTISITAEPEGGDGVLIAVADDGEGIPPDLLDKVFQPFFTTKRGEGGSGLGLHIVQTMVTGVLGGSLNVSSTVGEGTRFVLHLPREVSNRVEERTNTAISKGKDAE